MWDKYITQKAFFGPEIVGAKAWNLCKIQAFVRVPKFVVVSVDAFRYYKKQGSIPVDLQKEVEHVLKEVFNDNPIAVRSSGTAEDTKGRSYAGMYATILAVSGVDATISAIKKVWESNDSQRVQSYRKIHKLAPGEMAVILQQQIDSNFSGVMTTSGKQQGGESIIECCEGLGDKLVSGKITPTRYCMKNSRIVGQSGENLLSRKEVIELYKTGQKIEKIFRMPQDIEWAYQDKYLYILQARTLTAAVQTKRKPVTVWCNANVRETIPDPISPMGYSFFEKIWIPDIMINTFGFPLTLEQYEKYPPVERVLGHLYWNITNSAAYGKSIEPILKFTGAGTAIDPQMGEAMASVDSDSIPSLLPASRMLLFSLKAMMRMSAYLIKSFFTFRHARKLIDEACVEVNELAQDMHPTTDVNKGIENVRYWGQIISGRLSKRYFSGILISVFYLAVLSKILGWRMGKRGEAMARATTYGLIDKTGEMALAMHALAEYVHEKLPSVNNESLNALHETDEYFREKFNAFIVEYGHRGPGEFDIASLTWHEDKTLVYGMFQNKPMGRKNIDRSDIIENLLKTLSPFERFITKLFLPRIRELTPLRETAKHYVFKIMLKVKRQLSLIEEDLIQRGFLEEKRDIYFLRIDELEALRNKTLSKEQVVDMVHKRKAEWEQCLSVDVPDIVYSDGRKVFLSGKKQGDLTGTPLSYGSVQGRARIIYSFTDAYQLHSGDILVTHHTDPGWTPLFSIVSGVVIEVGGLICHAAMVARELGLPAIVLPGATSTIPDGAEIEIDADTGTVRIIGQ